MNPIVRRTLVPLFVSLVLLLPACGDDTPNDAGADVALDAADTTGADADRTDAEDDTAGEDAADATEDAPDTADSGGDDVEDASVDTDAADAADAEDADAEDADHPDTDDANDADTDIVVFVGTIIVAPETSGVIAGNPAEFTVTFETPGPRTAAALITFADIPIGVLLTPATLSIPADETSGVVTVSSDIDTPFAIARVAITADDGTYTGAGELRFIVSEYPGIDIAYAPDPLSVARGDAATLTATLTREAGWTGAVDIEVSGLPAGVTADPNPLRILPGETQATTSVVASSSAAEGAGVLTLGSSIPLRTREDEVALEVLPPSGFEVVAPDGLTVVAQGGSATVGIGVSGIPSGYPLDVSATVVTDGLVVSEGTIDAEGAVATLTIDAASNARLAVPSRLTVAVSDGSTASTGSFDVAVVPAPPSPLDPSFGTGGLVAARVGFNNGYFGGVLDGERLVVSGGAGQIDAFLSDGARDTTFGDAGSYLNPVRPQFRCLVRDADGRFVAGGVAGSNLIFVRLTAAGIIDETFGDAGVTTLPQSETLDSIDGCVLDAAGRLLLTSNTAVATSDLAVIRLTAAGALDDTFGTAGRALVDLGSDEYAYRVAVDADGRVLAAGYRAAAGPVELFITRLTDAGARDATFGTDGAVFVPRLQYPVGLGVLDDGTIAVMATGSTDTLSVRLNATTGALDTSFGVDGYASAFVGPVADSPASAEFEGDGAAWVAGRFGLESRFGVMRLDAAGVLDPSFSDDGWAALTVGDTSRYASGAVVESRGVYVYGASETYGLIALFSN